MNPRRQFAQQFSSTLTEAEFQAIYDKAKALPCPASYQIPRDILDLVGLVTAHWGPDKRFPTPVDAYVDMLKSFYSAFPGAKFTGKFTRILDRVYVIGLPRRGEPDFVTFSIPLFPDWIPLFMTELEHQDATHAFLAKADFRAANSPGTE